MGQGQSQGVIGISAVRPLDAAPIIVTAQLGPGDQAWADNLRRRHFPPERNHLAAHITLFHQLPPSCADELKRRLAAMTRRAAPDAAIDRLFSLGRGVALHVDCPELLAMRQDLADAFHGLLTPQDSQKPRLHITIQNKVTAEDARATLAVLSAGFVPRRVAIAALAMWHYRGGPWSPIASYRFRG